MEHWYGLPEAMLSGSSLQDYPLNYNYANEQHRFEEAGRLWKQSRCAVYTKMERGDGCFIKTGFHHSIQPSIPMRQPATLHKARRQEWHETYTLPRLWAFYQPSRQAHGSFWFSWALNRRLRGKKTSGFG